MGAIGRNVEEQGQRTVDVGEQTNARRETSDETGSLQQRRVKVELGNLDSLEQTVEELVGTGDTPHKNENREALGLVSGHTHGRWHYGQVSVHNLQDQELRQKRLSALFSDYGRAPKSVVAELHAAQIPDI